MNVKELKLIAERAELFNDLCGEREVKIAFNLSKAPMVDEVSTFSTLQINYLEFLEAFARIAYKSSLPRFTNVIYYLFKTHIYSIIIIDKDLESQG